MMESSKLAPIIHVTGVQRSGHSFIGDVITTNLGIAWWKQHADEPWVIKAALMERWTAVKPSLSRWFHFKGEDHSLFKADISCDLSPPDSVIVSGQLVKELQAVRITEYRKTKWFFEHVKREADSASMNINVVRDPRNVLASAIGKGWDQEHCEDLMGVCEFQYTDPTITSFINVSYEKTLAHLSSPEGEKSVAGIKINDWALESVIAIQKAGGNTSFGPVDSSTEYVERYKRPDIVANTIFQSLISKAEEIYNTHHIPFLESE